MTPIFLYIWVPVCWAITSLLYVFNRRMNRSALKAMANQKTKITTTNKELVTPVKTYELYGHPAAPMLVLQASLPSAPLGYGWEITTAINTEGNPALRLAMLDLKTATVIDAIEGDLVIIRRWKYAAPDTYADFYRRATEQELQKIVGYEGYGNPRPIRNADPSKLLGKVMLANLITPMVDWASLLVLRYLVEHPDETKCNYVLLESEAS